MKDSKHAAYTAKGERMGSFTKPHPQAEKAKNRAANRVARKARKRNSK